MSVIVGICGGSGAGKTYISSALKNVYKDKLTILSYDSYCKDHSDVPFAKRTTINYDTPESYDEDLLFEQVMKLKNNEVIHAPIYNFKEHTREKETIEFKPNEIIVVEGIMLFQVKKLIPYIDVKIFVDAPSDRRLSRRIKRDLVERGRSLDSVIEQYFATVKPMHDIYIEPTKKLADYVYNNDVNQGINQEYLSKITELINKKLLR